MFWYNGKLIQSQTLELNINDPGLLYGATVFTTLRVYGNSLDSSLTNWQAHCDRLLFSLKSFAWTQPDWKRLRQGAEMMLAHFPVLRIAIFPDGREWIIGRLLPEDLLAKQQHGVICAVANAELFRSLASHKTGNYLGAWLAINQAKSHAQEAILVDTTGNWLETATGNLWGWGDGNWWTPPLTAGILPGISRQQLIGWLYNHQQIVCEQPWTPELVKGLEAIAYTNSVMEIIPIHTVVQPTGSLQYDPYHPHFQQLKELFLT
ncbi:branched-chain amino acid aminotransferase/4-amino-4-deoxychorismate lyase [Nostoc sp. PCC 7524]|uniref:aminotransferase class IV n=1 Tax=Nostoc sp. (strain ATCC 29411 / PCC 7524) TaxID=28072 RepID=UPI00029EEAF1|nr:aminotransferase class IV [Nostoc sp. PCC 7524]AFY49128.1 branched-chain amino acid aminotransferase/4-amino-4-deoxychorismate lyase [Nostoc sp. PCC 7524]